MEATQKTSTTNKVLSLVLSVLLAVSCFSIAFPALIPGASAAATTAQWNALKSAFDKAKSAGYMSSGDYTGACSISTSGYNVTITDNTPRGYIYNIIIALQPVIANERANYTSNPQLQARIRDYSGLGLNTYQKGFINAVISTSGNLAYYSGNQKDLGETHVTRIGTGVSYPTAPSSTFSSSSSTIKVTRTLKAGILNDYPSSCPANNTSINTTAQFTLTETYNGPTTNRNTTWTTSWTTGSGTGKESHSTTVWECYTGRKEYFTCTACGSLSYSSASIGTTLSPILNYNSYIAQSYFKTGYDKFVANSSSVYDLDPTYLNEIYDSYIPYYNNISPLDPDYINAYISGGQAKVNHHLNYVNSCKGAYEAALLKPYVTWIQNDGYHVTSGDITRDNYTFTRGEAGGSEAFGTKAEYDHICALLTQAKSYYGKITSATSETQLALASVYGYSADEYTDYIDELTDYKQLYELNQIYLVVKFRATHDSTETYNGDSSLFGVTDYESYLYEKIYKTDENGTQVVDKSNWPMDDAMEASAKSWFAGKVSAIKAYKLANIEEVFTSPNWVDIQDLATALQVEYDYRNAEDIYYNSYYEYFEPIITGTDYTGKTDKYIQDLIANLENKLASMNTAISQAKAKIGQTKVNQIYGNYAQTVQQAINSYYMILWNRAYNDVYTMVSAAHDEDDNTPADEINSTNFSLVKRGIRDIDVDLYTWVTSTKASKFNSLVGSTAVNKVKTWYSWIPQYEKAIEDAMTKRWTEFKTVQLDSPAGSGTYTTRYVDAYGNDMVRDDPSNNGADKYVVTEAKINTVITKLDSFVNSPDFTKLIGVYDEEKGIDSLGGFIDNMLTEMLFTDDIVNTVIAMLLPMVCKLLDEQLTDMISNLEISGYNCHADTASGWSVSLNVYPLLLGANNGSNEFSGSGATIKINSGYADIAFDGKQSTILFPEQFHNLGLDIFPSYFGSRLPSSVNGVSLATFKSNLAKAGRSWNYFADSEGEITKLSLADKGAVWGCKDFNTFCTALGVVFSCIEPLVKVIFTGYDFQGNTASNFLRIRARDIKGRASYSLLSGDVLLNASGWGSAVLSIPGLQGYNNLWAPVMEALGITATTSSKDVSVATPLSSTLGTAGNNVTVTQIVKALITPIYALIKKLAAAPVSTLAGILPDLAMAVSYDLVRPLLDALKINLNLNASVDIDDWDDVELWGWLNLSFLASLFRSKINSAISDALNFDFPLDLGEMLSDVLSEEKLGMDISDLNSMANWAILKFLNTDAEEGEEKTDLAVSLPPINAGRLAHLGTLKNLSSIRTVNYNSDLASGRRYYIEADKADVLYDLVRWVLDFIAIDGNLSGLLVTLGQKPLERDISKIIAGISPEGALAALVELFVPQDYAMEEYHWYTPNSSASTFTFGSSADFVYTMYGNDWTLDKAEYMYDELETVVNSVVNMIDPEIYTELGVNGINELAQYYINSMFNNKGIMNVIKLFAGIGEALADQDMIVNMVKEQLQSNGVSTDIDLRVWYNSFGYLIYDYDALNEKLADPSLTAEEKEELKSLAPKKPGEAGYKNEFSKLSVATSVAYDEEGNAILDDDGNQTYEYTWSYRTSTTSAWQTLTDGADNARQLFTHIFSELFRPFSPIIDLVLTGADLSAFNGSIVINGYNCYDSAIIPVLEALGIKDLKTQAEYTAYSQANGSDAAFDYLVNRLFDYVTELLTIDANGYGPVQKIINLLPRVFYFFQSDGLTTLIKNLLHPVWAVIDTLRPIVNADIDGIVHIILTRFLELSYDETDTINYPTSVIAQFVAGALEEKLPAVEYSAAKAEEDKNYVDAIFKFSIEQLNLPAIVDLVNICFGLDLTPAIYAFEGMCVPSVRNGVVYGVKSYNSKSTLQNYWKELDFYGADTITVTICTVLDLIRYKDNESALDTMIGLSRELNPESKLDPDFTASGLLEALSLIFEDAPVALTGESPNWDYFLEGKYISTAEGHHYYYDDMIADATMYTTNLAPFVAVDISEYHSLYQLSYVTDWTPEIADNIDELLSGSLDYIVSLIDANKGGATTLSEFVNNLLNEYLFTGDLLKKIADLIGKIYNTIPEDVVAVVDNLLDVNITGWKQYVKKQLVVDETGNPVLDDDGNTTEEYQADPDHPWWADPEAAEYVDTDQEFYDAVNELLAQCAPLFGLIFLGDDYRLFRTIGNGTGSPEYGNDAIVLNGLNAYSRGLIPILEALGCDLSDYKPSKYVTEVAGEKIYDNELFVADLFDIVKELVDNVLADPYNYIIDILPNLVYFTNANGWSTALKNIIGAVAGVLDTVNMMLDENDRIGYTTLLEGFDLENLTLDTIFALLEQFVGIHIRSDLVTFIKTLYVGVLETYVSANGMGAFRMNTNKTFLDPTTGRYKEGRGDFITILVSLIVEILTDEGEYVNDDGELVQYSNPAIIDKLIAGDDEDAKPMVEAIINILKNPTDPSYLDINWDYFDEDLNLSDSADNVVNIKPYQFLYLNYTTDWTEAKAENVVGEFDELLLSVLKMLDDSYADATDASAVISDMLKLDSFFTAATLQSILDLVSPLLYGPDAVLPEALLNLAGALLGADLTEWNYKYAFADKEDGTTYEHDDEVNLDYAMVTTVDEETNEEKTIKTYAIENRDEFISGLTLILKPAYRLLSWILFGEGYDFFISNTDATLESRLIKINGPQGYKYGLSLLLEALGIDDYLKTEDKYLIGYDALKNTFESVDMAQFVNDLLKSVCTRMDEIIADPVEEVENLISELIYFINAGGLQVTIQNLAAALLNLLDVVNGLDIGVSLDIDELLGGLINSAINGDLEETDPAYIDVEFKLEKINLEYIFYIVEVFTGLCLNDVVGNTLEYFKIGQVYAYPSASGTVAYKCRFDTNEDFADFVTILLSFVVDVFEYEGNAEKLEDLIGLDNGILQAVAKFLRESYIVETNRIDWFYFDGANTLYNPDGTAKDPAPVYDASTVLSVSENAIAYLSYASDWTRETAETLYQNRNEIIKAVLQLLGADADNLGDLIASKVNLDELLYTKENLQKILDLVTGVTGKLDASIKSILNIVIDVDLAAYDTMEITDVNGRTDFAHQLYDILAPIAPVLDWLLFGDDIQYFDKKDYETNNIQILINLPGADGYANALVPILEALGVIIPTVKADDTTKDVLYVLINNVLARVETILDNPVDEVIAMLPELIYFVNTNALSTCINNLLSPVVALLNEIGPTLGLGTVDELLDSVLADAGISINLKKLDWYEIFTMVEEFTGIEITDVLTEAKIENFFFGKMTAFDSASGKTAFRMDYSETQAPCDMLTFVLNLLLDVLMYQNGDVNNPAAVDTLVGTDGTVEKVVGVIKHLRGITPVYEDVNWNYFGGTVTGTGEASTITPPATPFNNYLAYTSDWTKETANYLYDNLDTIASAVLKMIDSVDAESVADLLSGVNLFQGKYLNTIVEAIQKLYDILPAEIIAVIDTVIGTNINGWRDLSYADADMTAGEFVNALVEILEPVYVILDWLLFGDTLEYFIEGQTGATLIKLPGSEGYARGLALILEALGVELPAYDEATASCATMMRPVLTAITVRIAEIFADPVDEALELLPNLLYFINANGASVAVGNLLAAVKEALPDIGKLIGKEDLTYENLLKTLVDVDLDITNLDIVNILTYVENNVDLKGLKILEVFNGTVNGTTFIQDPAGEDNLIAHFYLGDVAAYQSTTGYAAYRMDYNEENRGDLLTMLLSMVLQVAIYEDNAAPIAAFINNDDITEETILALVQILTSGAVAELGDINWTYYLGLEDQAAIDAKITELATNTTTAINGIQITRTANYLKYSNNWNEETAKYLSDNLPEIVDLVINMVTSGEQADLVALLNSVDQINNLYSDETVDFLVGKVAGALQKAIDAVGVEILDAAGQLLDVDILAVANYKSSGVHDKATFAESLANAFNPLGQVLDWILFGRDYQFFTKLEDGSNAIIKLNGNEGFKYGLAPILAALGVDTHIEAMVAAADADKSITEQVLAKVLENVCDVIDDILADPINEVFALLPELIYFINANGVKTGVANVLAPVDALLAEVGAALGMDGTTDKKDISSVAKIANQPIINNLTFEGICELVLDKTGVDVWGAIGGYIDQFYFGQLTHYTSYDGIDGFRMEYSATEEQHDFITVLLTVVLDVATYEGNSEFFINLIDDKLVKEEDKDENQTKAKQMYYAIIALLTGNETLIDMQDFDWLFVTKAPIHPEWIDTGVAVSPLMTGSAFDYIYGPLYKREMGEYITKWLPEFIDTMIVLLGIEGADGDIYRSLDDIIDNLLGGTIYTNDILYKLLDTLQNLVPMIENAIGEELTAHAAEVVKDSLGVDLMYWNDYTINTIADGDRDAFVAEIVRMLRPAYPLLKWLLIEGEDIAFFNKGTDGSDYIVLKAADGYAYSIIPILEALHCEGIVTPAQFKADADADADSMLNNILTPLLNKVDTVLADPINEVLKVATSAIYFLNSNAADTCFKNLLNAVLSLLNAIEPITGEINVYNLIGLDLAELNIETLLETALQGVEEKYGFKLTKAALSAIKELTVGYVRSFTSLNGRKAYTMDYATGADQTDLVSVVLRFALVFISIPENATALKAMLNGKLSDEGYKFVCALLDNFSQMNATSEGMDTVMYTVYYIFYSANVAAHETENWIAEFNGNYSFLNQLFATSDVAFFRQLEKSLGDLLNKWTSPVVDDDQVMPNGAIPFFKAIANFFQKIIAFFKSLFGM